MTKSTHLVAGMAITLGIVRPENFSELAICLSTASIGSLISDIDVSTSKSRDELNKILIISIISILICVFLERFLHIGILEMIKNQSNMSRILVGILMMLLICCFGITTNHRTFMHSIIGVIGLSATVWVIFPGAMIPFAVSMMSHIFLDFFNTRRIQLFYPLKKPRIAFKLCKSDGFVNQVIFYVSMIIIDLQIILFFYKIIKISFFSGC